MAKQLDLPLTQKKPPKNGGIDETLKERGKRYGEFKEQAKIAEALNEVFVNSPNWASLPPDSREALRLIANKIARILNGDPEYDDNWRDVAGYSTLVLNRITEQESM